MKPVLRPHLSENDYWRMRQFLRQLFSLDDRLEHNWHVARLDYARWHSVLNCAHLTLADVVSLWEADGQLVAFMMPDGVPDEAHFMVHPAYRTLELEEEMLAVAEQRLAEVKPDGSHSLVIWSPVQDSLRQGLLTGHGYLRQGLPEKQWRRKLDQPVLEAPASPGYTIRALGDGLELLERCYASGLAFHQGDTKIALDNRDDPTWYRNIQTAPLYRRDLDLVAIAVDGSIAAFCTIWFDDVTRSACFEPVGVVPAHQRRGLGRLLMVEGLRRLQKLGALTAFVSGYSQAANGLYQSVMGDEHVVHESWVKNW